jgi:hypothetical protein
VEEAAIVFSKAGVSVRVKAIHNRNTSAAFCLDLTPPLDASTKAPLATLL